MKSPLGMCSAVTNMQYLCHQVPGKKTKEGRSEKVLDTMNENILQVAKNINLWLQETEQIQSV